MQNVLFRRVNYPYLATFLCPIVYLYAVSTWMAVNGVQKCSLRFTYVYTGLNFNIFRGWRRSLLMLKSKIDWYTPLIVKKAACARHIVKTSMCSGSSFPSLFTAIISSADFLEYFPQYLQIARGRVWLILIKFNLFWWSIWKSPKCCLHSVCELSDRTARLSITSAPVPGVEKVLVSDAHWPTCTLALTPGCSPNSDCQFIHFPLDYKSHHRSHNP